MGSELAAAGAIGHPEAPCWGAGPCRLPIPAVTGATRGSAPKCQLANKTSRSRALPGTIKLAAGMRPRLPGRAGLGVPAARRCPGQLSGSKSSAPCQGKVTKHPTAMQELQL